MSRPVKGKERRGARERSTAGEPLRVNLISLGCPKNLVDSELILGQVGGAGLTIAQRPEDADVIVVNTCSFIDSAKEESIQTILEACELKRASRSRKRVVVTGCLAQRYGEELRREVPEVDAIVGLGQYQGMADLLRGLAEAPPGQAQPGQAGSGAGPREGGPPADGGPEEGGPLLKVSEPDWACNAEVGRFRLTPRHYGYLRISEGCDNPCTFCSIPSFRGRFRSKPLEMVEEEARELVASGARELILISQDTTSYGVDLQGRYELPRLLERVAGVEGVRWVRLLYVYPACFSDEMIDAVASLPQVVKYIDIPLQHIGDRMLRRMGRRMDETDTRRLLSRMRERIPGLYLRTTFIVGFPGEEEEDFRSLLDFVREFRFERLGVFPYSREEGTPAARLKEEVPAQTVTERIEELMLAQQEVAFAQNQRRVGEVCEVVVDGRQGGVFRARSHGEAPEIDPVILLKPPPAGTESRPVAEARGEKGGDRRHAEAGTLPGPSRAPSGRGKELPGFHELAVLPEVPAPEPRLEPGSFVEVEITGTKGYDLLARPASRRGGGSGRRPGP